MDNGSLMMKDSSRVMNGYGEIGKVRAKNLNLGEIFLFLVLESEMKFEPGLGPFDLSRIDSMS